MKKSLLFAATALTALTLSAQDKTWNLGDMLPEAKLQELIANGNMTIGNDGKGNTTYDFKGVCTVDGLTFYSNFADTDEKPGRWSLQAGNGKSEDGELTFTSVLKSGGSSFWKGQPTNEDPTGLPEAQWTPETRILSFDVDGACDILLYYVSANASAQDRYAELYYNSHENLLGSYLATSASGSIHPWHYRYTGEAGKIYVSCSGGLNFYGIQIKPATEQPDVKPIYTYCEIAEGSLNPDGLSDENGALGKINVNPAQPVDGFEYGTKVTFSYSGANNFALDHWMLDSGEEYPAGNLELVVGDDWNEVTAVVKYVDPYNAVPGYLDGNTAKAGTLRDWSVNSQDAGRQITCIPLSANEGDEPAKNTYTSFPWPKADTKAFSWPALSGNKGVSTWEFQIRVTEAGNYNLVAAVSNKQGGDGSLAVTVFKGDNADGEIAAEGNAVVPVTFQDWNFIERKVELDGALEPGIYFVRIVETTGDTGRAGNMLYAIMGIGDNYGNWAEKNPANNGQDAIDNITINGTDAPVRYFNLQGIEVNADTKGLIILSNGTKVLNK